jgi:hypothetical protein
LTFQLDPPERKPLSENTRYLVLDLPLLFHISSKTVLRAGSPSSEIDLPDLLVGISVAVQERTADVLTEDAAIFGGCLVPTERHLPLINYVVICYARTKIAAAALIQKFTVPVGTTSLTCLSTCS